MATGLLGEFLEENLQYTCGSVALSLGDQELCVWQLGVTVTLHYSYGS